MTLKELAYVAQSRLQARIGSPIRRGHVLELFAAAAGFRSWAAFDASALLADAGTDGQGLQAHALIVGRAIQLEYPTADAELVAAALIELIGELQLSFVEWQALVAAVHASSPRSRESLDDEDELADEDLEDDEWETESRSNPRHQPQSQTLPTPSPLLLDSLERAAQLRPNDPVAHYALAAFYRCERPSPYLYEESLKGRKLSSIEQGWVEGYLRAAPLYEKYACHLKAAASLGDRMAALEYAELLGGRALYEVVDKMEGPVSAQRMAELAPDDTQRLKWLRVAAAEGAPDALAVLARRGDPTALTQMAARGDVDAIRTLATEALDSDNAMDAWQWQKLALLHGYDLTVSTMRAYHDGGERDGQFYDSDFGGGLYAAGDEGLELPDISKAQATEAAKRARVIYQSAGLRR
ncbi:hypothetical protein [Variovorax sp. 38R]|uniref:hypothetical protein n=1 Tax=Variovorax sp. 38R TaxID=2774875 RepID=UPI00177E8F5F|nr:hypothetical protein [Variovorax sp. 38R]QOF77561.1 hypothetical protein IG196_24945 [Variovorax sp. 38R]